MTIPKVIHYCWFGHNPLPESVETCIASWRKLCPDYEIKRWDESNFDVSQHPYTRAAYEAKKYAFVSDVARLQILHDEGGFYLDTDVELLQSLDSLREHSLVLPLETKSTLNTGLGFGAEPNHPFLKFNLLAYKHRSFVKDNGNYDLTSCVTITTDVLKSFPEPWRKLNQELKTHVPGQKLTLRDSLFTLTVLPMEFMAPINLETGKMTLTPHTISIHHYDATWQDHKPRFVGLKIKLRRLLGSRLYDAIKDKLL